MGDYIGSVIEHIKGKIRTSDYSSYKVSCPRAALTMRNALKSIVLFGAL